MNKLLCALLLAGISWGSAFAASVNSMGMPADDVWGEPSSVDQIALPNLAERGVLLAAHNPEQTSKSLPSQLIAKVDQLPQEWERIMVDPAASKPETKLAKLHCD